MSELDRNEQKQQFVSEVQTRLRKRFSASKEGYSLPDMDRLRLEGFMACGVFLGLVTRPEMAVIMEDVHQQVFGQSIAERRAKMSELPMEDIDYSQYDAPAYIRNKLD